MHTPGGVVFQESGMSCRQDKSERMPKTDQGNLINLEKAKVLRKKKILSMKSLNSGKGKEKRNKNSGKEKKKERKKEKKEKKGPNSRPIPP